MPCKTVFTDSQTDKPFCTGMHNRSVYYRLIHRRIIWDEQNQMCSGETLA